MVYFSKFKIIMVMVICAIGLAFAAPNLFPSDMLKQVPDWLPHKRMHLGLDLQGGSHLLLEVDLKAITRERLNTLVDTVRLILRKARIGYRGLGVEGDAVVFRLRDPDQLSQARELLRTVEAGTEIETGDLVVVFPVLTRLPLLQ